MYCSYCGQKMNEEKDFIGYSKSTGNKLYRISYKCPDRVGYWSNHDYESLDDLKKPYTREEWR